ncbi:hemerythrin domain-containing protein [Actinomadura litoris]|uniref:hemerythrin domain-containing protein n=1 Tax=Actinomadura litoris TaxID=2678616 RepID=UPI001FA7E04E|nr:hemerythrin domain-containing protein [Actinomadura litoris]
MAENPVNASTRPGPGGAALGDALVRIHDDLRVRLAALREKVLAALDGRAPAQDLGAELREHCAAVCGALGEHHDNEETRGFPLLAREAPGLAPVLGRLRREHVEVERARRSLQALLDDLGAADPARVRAELDRITARLDAHFAYEEDQLREALNGISL